MTIHTIRNRRGVAACVAALMLAHPLRAQQPFAPHRAIEIAVEDEAEPWSRRDGTGSANDVVRADRPGAPKQNDQLANGLVVGVVRGYEYPPSVYLLEQQGAIVLEESPSEVINLKKLSVGRIGATIINHNETKRDDYVIAQADAKGKVRRTGRAGILNSFIGFSRRHPDTKWALERFNTGFLAIVKNGELNRIEQRWAAAAP